MTHTPGPWEINGELVVCDQAGNEICLPAIGAQLTECKENARLIAAAPDLLAALKEYLNYCGDFKGTPMAQLNGEARTAIAKAEGR
jgi:hypothetical protein